jgi:hypothetical protein
VGCRLRTGRKLLTAAERRQGLLGPALTGTGSPDDFVDPVPIAKGLLRQATPVGASSYRPAATAA